jgi:hypothetical protein
MSYITSIATGLWSTGTTWSAGVQPASGDSVTISHTVTADSIHTIGASAAVSNVTALEITSTGALIINPGAKVTIRGDVGCVGPTSGAVADLIQLEGGGQYWIDNSQSTASVTYYTRLGRANNQRVRFVTRGSAASICTVGSVAGGAPSTFSRNAFTATNFYNCTYTDFVRMGANGTSAIYLAGLTSSIAEATFDHCVFDTCGQLEMNTISSAQTVSITSSVFTNTVDTALKIAWQAGAPAGAVRLIADNVIGDVVNIANTSGGTIDGNVFGNTIVASGTGSYMFTGNMVRQTGAATGHATHASIYSNYYVADGAFGNAHYISPLNAASGDVTLSGCIFEQTATAGNGDCILGLSGNASGTTYIITRNLVLPNGGGDSSGALNLNGGSNATILADYNTTMAGSNGGLYCGESYGRANLILSARGNLSWDSTARGYKIWRDTSNIIQDIISAGSANFNSGWSFAPGSDGKGYQGSATTHLCSGTPGANDVEADPQFVDKDRGLAKWASSLGFTSSTTSAIQALFSRLNRSGGNSNATVGNLWNYVAEGFRPTNTSLRSASHQSLTIGAFAGSFGAGGAVTYPLTKIHGQRGARSGGLLAR